MLNVTCVAVVMMALITLWMISNNMWNSVVIADFANHNPFKARNFAESIVPKNIAKAYMHLMQKNNAAADEEIEKFCKTLESKRIKGFEKKFVDSMPADLRSCQNFLDMPMLA